MPKITGVGDIIKLAADFLGFETCEKCERRRQALNRAYPFTKNVYDIITEEEANEIGQVPDNTHRYTKEQKEIILRIYNKYFDADEKVECDCASVYGSLTLSIKVLIEFQRIGKE